MAWLLESRVGDLDLFVTRKLVGIVAAASGRVLLARGKDIRGA